MNVKNGFTLDKVLKVSLLCFLCMTIIALVKSNAKPNDPLYKQQAHLAVRAIGDALLTHADDVSSPVPPLQEIQANTFRLSFQDPIPINPDFLSWLAMQHITPEITSKAIVNVMDVASGKVVYGFEINYVTPKNIPCLGRLLPASAYYVEVSFYERQPLQIGVNAFTIGAIGFLGISLVLLGVSFFRDDKPIPTTHHTIQVKGIKLDLNTNQLTTKDQQIKLTDKEVHLLSILLNHEGQLVSREYLTQEVWLKQGVVTSRSLDMYISRLRKKVKALSHTEILNQRGKGYILKVS